MFTIACWTTSALAAAICTPPFEETANGVIMIGPLVIAPAGYALAALLAGTSLVMMTVAFVLRRRAAGAPTRVRNEAESAIGDAPCIRHGAEEESIQGKVHGRPSGTPCALDARPHCTDCRDARNEPAPLARRKGSRRVIRWIGNGAAICAIAASLATSGLFCLVSQAYVADPPSTAGDRIVVVERNVLLSGYGTAYFVPHGMGCGVEIAEYSADDGYSPMTFGTYTLSWQGREPVFVAQGTPAAPVSMYGMQG